MCGLCGEWPYHVSFWMRSLETGESVCSFHRSTFSKRFTEIGRTLGSQDEGRMGHRIPHAAFQRGEKPRVCFKTVNIPNRRVF